MSGFPAGRHAWLWRLEKVKDWNEVFRNARNHGFVGLHLHAQGPSLAAVATRDLVMRARDAGIYLGASLACDTGTIARDAAGKPLTFTGTPWQKFVSRAEQVSDLLGPDQSFCFNWEMRWERRGAPSSRPWHPDRRPDAKRIAQALLANRPDYGWWDAPWWKPSVHPTAPTDEWGALMKHRVPQTYFVYSDDATKKPQIIGVPTAWKNSHPDQASPPQYMVGTAKLQYGQRGVQRPLEWGFQATAEAGADRYVGLCLREYPTTVWWHFLRLWEPGNEPTRKIFRAAALIDAWWSGNPTVTFGDRVRAFQTEHRLTPDGWLRRDADRVIQVLGP